MSARAHSEWKLRGI